MTKNPAQHLPAKAPKRTGRAGVKPLDPVEDFETPLRVPEPEPPTSEEVKEFLDGAAATREKRKEKAKKPQVVKDPQKGKTERLPGMDDAILEELEDAAREYANTRDDRMRLLEAEVELKASLLDLMKKNKKTFYKRDGITIQIVAKDETVKVKLVKEED
jgi:hypothetical protein